MGTGYVNAGLVDNMKKYIKIYGMAVLMLGVMNILGLGKYESFARMFSPLPAACIFGIYIYTVFYSIACIYCGAKIRLFEDWARKMVVVLAGISVVLSLLINRIAISNLKGILSSNEANIPIDMINSVYNWIVVFTFLITLFELSIVFFFTRPKVREEFRKIG